MLLGNVYCSLHGKAMGDLSTGTFTLKSKKLEETSDHVSRLSIRCTLSGEQHYKVGGNDFLVKPDNYLLVNQGQHYKTSFEADTEQEMILVAFRPGFAESLYYSLSNPTDVLLDNPFNSHTQKINFFEKTYDCDPMIQSHFQRLKKIMELDPAAKQELDMDGIYTALFTRLLVVQQALPAEFNKLKAVKRATREELFRRLSIAKDFMDANLGLKIYLEDIARIACLSVHHFKREFRTLYGISPHRYLLVQRIVKAKTLLNNSSFSIDEVAIAAGFENVSSFIRQFKEHTGNTPGVFRRTTGLS